MTLEKAAYDIFLDAEIRTFYRDASPLIKKRVCLLPAGKNKSPVRLIADEALLIFKIALGFYAFTLPLPPFTLAITSSATLLGAGA